MSDEDRIFQILGEVREMRGGLKEFRKNTERQLGEIRESLEGGNKAFENIRLNCVKEGARIDSLEASVESLEKTGLPQKTRWKIDGSLLLGIINGTITIVKTWLGMA